MSQLNYSNLTYSDILSQVNSLIESDTRFANFREGDVAKFLVEMFAATTDITNYYIERRAEECFMDTARLKSSVIRLARMFGYDIKRRIPARANISIRLSGNFTEGASAVFVAGDQLQIPMLSSFEYNGTSFVLKKTLVYTFTSTDIANMINSGDNYEKIISVDTGGDPITVIQGQLNQKIFTPTTNIQLNQTFQQYNITDKSFSDYYGDDDILYTKLTKVEVGTNVIKRPYQIDRRSLINWKTITKNNEFTDPLDICLIRSIPNEGVEIVFGDDRFASIGAKTGESVFVTYLSTDGITSNKTGVVNKKINIADNFYVTPAGLDISDRISFTFNTNIYGGVDFEDIESIRYGTPSIYSSLDRLVSKADYTSYLKTLTTPITVKNAVAWGENEQRGSKFFDQKSTNLVYFSILGSLYNLAGPMYGLKSNYELEQSALIDDDFMSEYSISNQSIFNVYSRKNVVTQIVEYTQNVGAYNFDIRRCYESNTFGDDGIKIKLNPKSIKATMPITFGASDDVYDMSNNQTTTVVVSGVDKITSLESLQQKIKTALLTIIDMRGSTYTNANYGLPAFSSDIVVQCSYDSEFLPSGKTTIAITIPSSSPTHITYIGTSSFTSLLGINDSNSVPVFEYVDDAGNVVVSSGRIHDVVADVNSRSQITVQSIYISPTIHTINLAGNVYIKSMYDKNTISTQIKNAIYSWLDQNADFNVQIPLSNIIEIVENNVGTINCDIYFGVSSKALVKDTKGYVNSIKKSYTNAGFTPATNRAIDETFVTFDLFKKKSDITENLFINSMMVTFNNYLVNTVYSGTEYSDAERIDISYDVFGVATSASPPVSIATMDKYQYSPVFLSFLGQIRRTLSYYVQSNLMGNGNISNYSMVNEICRVDLSGLNFTYKA